MSELQFDAEGLIASLADTSLAPWSEALAAAVLNQGHALKHGHLPRWEAAIKALPEHDGSGWRIEDGAVCTAAQLASDQTDALEKALSELMPWRKGPFLIGPILLDTEWRSDWKWDRIIDHLEPLQDRLVLDVGCGSGYHLWRMREAGARQVLGIDPSLLYLKQFEAVQHYARETAMHFLPLPMEALPENMQVFDTIFSMGVLYHRREPMSHLAELRQALRPGGELVLETLIMPGEGDASLAIGERYANMRNIYELPTIEHLENWVACAGFNKVRTVSVQETSLEEQRRSHWMQSHSLEQALRADDPSLTIEGYPRPTRAVVLATA
ncbi:tRNA 5-methoxyuridine(34)/uridine 5-oxyacetic acid(34) synthase CmoB [Granulosicoccus sp. 3-233]|uniref:tRNA 5-methoxyuridine(34)/uridine 5-oxyacetic acid(34) synthase CmoB n=1 Tax=Granulosicoccus sp. 3-233 TaxID=3417969 RepID=UPI003D3296CB